MGASGLVQLTFFLHSCQFTSTSCILLSFSLQIDSELWVEKIEYPWLMLYW
ncbi:hypothetical protein SEVIR_1G257850v4 [Setaria viridis]|uniref:Uncharacterized protein n=1 Tax=Setaria viridis TaxID=4556 RepID=A0A4V6DD69_SETVI|nr:hypothetical protein SEVIR_1G257850v2 [Setaria viridis]